MTEAQTFWSVDQAETITVSGVHTLRVLLVSGEIDVVAGTGEQAVVEISEVDGSPVTVEFVDGVLTVAHERLSWGGVLSWFGTRRHHAVVSVSVPRETAIDVGVVTAHATVTGVLGDASVRAVSGDVILDGCSGDVRADTVSGRLETRGLVGALAFKSVSGELAVVAAKPSSIRAKTVSGDVLLDLDGIGDLIDATSISGDVTVRLPKDAALDVHVKSTSGRVASAFPGVTMSRSPGTARLQGSIGAGGGTLRAKTVSGDVSILAGG